MPHIPSHPEYLDAANLDAEADWLSDDDRSGVRVFPDSFSRPCERCAAPSLGGRWCPDCEAYLESLDLPGAH